MCSPDFIMKRNRRAPSIVCTIALALICKASFAESSDYMVNEVPSGFQAIFDGKTLSGWHGQPQMSPQEAAAATAEDKAKWQAETEPHWSVNESAIVNDGHGPYLTTDKNYRDFELLLQYKTVAKADSGIYLRGIPQVQIWDRTNSEVIPLGADKGSGGLFNNDPGPKVKIH